MQVSTDHDSAERTQTRAIASLIGLLLLGLVDNQILSPLLPEMASSFRVSVGRIGATVSGYALAAAAAALVVGPLSDRGGRRAFLLGAGFVFGLGSITVTLSPTFSLFVLARVVSGAAAGIISVLVVASIADRVPYERRGRAMGWVASAYFAAPILGVPAGAWLAEQFGWRAVYVVFTFGAGLMVGALWCFVAEDHHELRNRRRSRDVKEVAAGYLGFLRGKTTAVGAYSAFFISGGITVLILYLGAYLRERFGLSVTGVGLVFLLSGVASLAGALGAGPVADRLGKRTVAIGGSLALAAFIAAVPVLGGVPLYACLGMVGLAAASRVAPLQSLVTELVNRESRGAYVALRNTLSQLGIAVSAFAGAALYAWGGFTFVCYLAVAFSLTAAVLLWFIEEPTVA